MNFYDFSYLFKKFEGRSVLRILEYWASALQNMNWVSLFLADGFDMIEAGSLPGGIDTEKRKPEQRAPAFGPLDCHWG